MGSSEGLPSDNNDAAGKEVDLDGLPLFLTTPEETKKFISQAREFNGYPAFSVELPNLFITEKSDKGGFTRQLGHSLAYSLTQAPIESFAQGVDKISERTELQKLVHGKLVSAPEPTEFGSAEWHGQVLGGAAGIIPWFLASRGALRGLASTNALTRGLVVSKEMAMANTSVLSATGQKLMFESGLTASAYAGAFKLVGDHEGNYWQAKAKHMATDFATFYTLAGSTIYLSPKLNFVSPYLAERYPRLAASAQRGTAMSAGAISGIPASIVNTTLHNGFFEDSIIASPQKYAENAYTFAFLGFGLSALHPIPGRIRATERKEEPHFIHGLPIKENLANGFPPPWKPYQPEFKSPFEKEPYDYSSINHPPVLEKFPPKDFGISALQSAFKRPEYVRHLSLEELSSMSFPKWWETHKEDPSVIRYLGQSNGKDLGLIWDRLSPEQRALHPEELSSLALIWNSLSAEKWSSLNGKETGKTARLLSRLAFTREQSEKLLDNKPLMEWLEKNEGFFYGLHFDLKNKFITMWDHLPSTYRELPTESLRSVLNSWDKVPVESWQNISPRQAVDVAMTIYALNLRGEQAKQVAANPEFATYFSQNAMDIKTSLGILNCWHRLSPEEKTQHPFDLKQVVQKLEALVQLESTFPPDSPVIRYLQELEGSRPKLIYEVAYQINQVKNGFRTNVKLEEIVAKIEEQVKKSAPPEQFAGESLSILVLLDKALADKPDLKARLLKNAEQDWKKLGGVLIFLSQKPEHRRLVELLDQQEVLAKTFDRHSLSQIQWLADKLKLDDAALLHLISLEKQGMDRTALVEYVNSSDFRANLVKSLVEARKGPSELEPKQLYEVETIRRITGLNETESQRLTDLYDQGFPVRQLENLLIEFPQRLATVRRLLNEGAEIKQIVDYMRLQVLPDQVAYKIAQAAKERKLSTEEVLAELKKWKTGNHFMGLLVEHVESGRPLVSSEIKNLASRAQSTSTKWFAWPRLEKKSPHPSAVDESTQNLANMLVEGADKILAAAPAGKPIVILGRDAWPLVALLRARGRDAQYFLWSRLQLEDKGTHQQWLREVPPNAYVVDTGYNGTIVNRIKQIDQGVSGDLLSSYVNSYRSLVSEGNKAQVEQLESFPKLIYRTSRHNTEGNAISRRKSENSDGDAVKDPDLGSRWVIERKSRNLLRAAGLPDWEVWRYGNYVGLTPGERLGLNSKSEVEQLYLKVESERKAAGKPTADTIVVQDKAN